MEFLRAARRERPAELAAASAASLGMRRYADVLPDVTPVTLGEGWTPMIRSRRYEGLLVKEEGANPAGSSEARGLAMAVTMAKHYGLKHLAVASEGNAAGALAAYAAAGQIAAHIFMPRDVPFANYLEGVLYGADVTLVDGLISDCARLVGERIKAQREAGAAAQDVWFDISTLQEPFRVEGKKTMGYELVEQLGWEYPDAVFYLTGGGAGLIGMWKAFEEMEHMGWVEGKRPRMYALRAAELGAPKPYSDSTILEIVRASGGKVVATDDAAILASLLDWAREEGVFLSPEGAAATAAHDTLRTSGEIKKDERVVLFNTGAGLKYVDMVAEAMQLRRPGSLPTSLPVGGIISPV